jgi:hypothetical protein
MSKRPDFDDTGPHTAAEGGLDDARPCLGSDILLYDADVARAAHLGVAA